MHIQTPTRRMLALLLTFLFVLTGLFATDDYRWSDSGGDYRVSLSGTIFDTSGEKVLQIQLANKETSEVVNLISFPDLTELNSSGSIITEDVFRISYSYSAPEGAAAVMVRIEASSDGMTMDGGESYPIGISFVNEDNVEEEVKWDAVAIETTEGNDYVVFQTFRLKLTNRFSSSIPAGLYTGIISLTLQSV